MGRVDSTSCLSEQKRPYGSPPYLKPMAAPKFTLTADRAQQVKMTAKAPEPLGVTPPPGCDEPVSTQPERTFARLRYIWEATAQS